MNYFTPYNYLQAIWVKNCTRVLVGLPDIPPDKYGMPNFGLEPITPAISKCIQSPFGANSYTVLITVNYKNN